MLHFQKTLRGKWAFLQWRNRWLGDMKSKVQREVKVLEEVSGFLGQSPSTTHSSYTCPKQKAITTLNKNKTLSFMEVRLHDRERARAAPCIVRLFVCLVEFQMESPAHLSVHLILMHAHSVRACPPHARACNQPKVLRTSLDWQREERGFLFHL